jgi:hypothetical protein
MIHTGQKPMVVAVWRSAKVEERRLATTKGPTVFEFDVGSPRIDFEAGNHTLK